MFWGLVRGIRLHWGGGHGNYPASQSQGMSEQERGMVAGLRTKETDGDGSLARVVAGGDGWSAQAPLSTPRQLELSRDPAATSSHSRSRINSVPLARGGSSSSTPPTTPWCHTPSRGRWTRAGCWCRWSGAPPAADQQLPADSERRECACARCSPCVCWPSPSRHHHS